MWHEARKHEKLLRTTMVDQSKRAERKRRYFELVRKDPEQFMQLHGHKSHIFADSSIAKAAEDSNILRAWQGEPSITIDRFDVRSHLTKMDLMFDGDDMKTKKKEELDDKEEIVSEFERYRVLIINDYKGVTEKNYLRKIAEREFWQVEKDSAKKIEAEKKKKSADKKSTIGFSYDDSETVKGNNDETEKNEESDEEITELEDIDVDLDTKELNPESQRQVNKTAEDYGVKRALFCALLRADQQAQRDAAQLKQIDRQKAQLSGRESKHERMLLRQQRQAIVGKGCQIGESGATATLLGFINNSSKKSKIDEMMNDMNKGDKGDEKVKPEFITTFGGNDEAESDEEMKKSSVGPELPSEQYRKILELSKKRNNDERVDWGDMKLREATPPKRRSRSRSRERRRTRTPPSRDRSRDRDRRRRSRSRSRNRRRRSRTRSKDRRTTRRSRSPYSRRRSRSHDRYHRRRDHRNRSRSHSRPSSKDRKKKNTSPEKAMFQKKPERLSRSKTRSTSSDRSAHLSDGGKSEEDVKMLEIRSSMSDSEKERVEIENRKRRVKLTKKMVKGKRQGDTVDGKSSDEEEECQKRGELVRKMQIMLKKTRKEMAKEEEEKRREADVQKRVREEMRFIEEQERKERERAKKDSKDVEKRRRRSNSKSPKRRE